jgi:hypothetical protein
MASTDSFPSILIQSLLSGSQVQNRVRTFGDFTLDMELVAVDGLVGAARLGGIKKGPVSALAGALAELPPRIKSDLAEMEEICTSYARALASSAYVALRYRSLHEAAQIIRAEDLESDRTARNLKILEEHMRASQITFEDSLFQARGALRRVRAKLRDFEAIVRSAQYVGNYMSIEAAALEDGDGNFTSLAGEIHRQAVRLAEVLDALFSDANKSELLMPNRNGGLAA